MIKCNLKSHDNNLITNLVTFTLQAGFFLSLLSTSFSTRYIKPKAFTCYHSSSEHYKIVDATDNNGGITWHTIGCSHHPLPYYGHRYVCFHA
jgi:hypothetical protein